MSIKFIPLGIPFSSSFAISASIANNTAPAGFPANAYVSEFAINEPGPDGAPYKTISGSKVTLS